MVRRPTPAQSANVKNVLRADEARRNISILGRRIPEAVIKQMYERWDKERANLMQELSEDEYAAYLLIKHEQEMKSSQQLPA